MTTDFRALCVELVDCLEKADWPHRYKVVFQQWIYIARKALAEPEPEGPTDEELRQLYCELFSLRCSPATLGTTPARFARTVLARWSRSDGPAVPDGREPASVASEPSDAGPAAGEVAELVAWLRERSQERETLHLPGAELSKQLRTAPYLLTRAADLLERLSPPQPIAVSERLPGSGDCDAEGLCWVWNFTAYTWGLFRLDLTAHSHWLPFHALPLPQ